MRRARDYARLFVVSLEDASDHLTAALRSLAISERPLQQRLQEAWDDHVQMLWMKPCLTAELLRQFKDLWRCNTAPSDDRTNTKLRDLTRAELERAIDGLLSLSAGVTAVASQSPHAALATLADLA